MNVHHYLDVDSMPEAIRNFLDKAGSNYFFNSLPWFETLLSEASPPSDHASIFVAEYGSQPTAALVAKQRSKAGTLRSRMLLSPSHGMYTSLYSPILQGEHGFDGLRAIISTIARQRPAFDVMRFDSLEYDAPTFDFLVQEFRANKLLVQPFFNFHNWFENVAGLSIAEYVARRSTQTRYFINRHVRRVERSGRGRFELVTGGPRLASALVDYELVDLQSWKAPEPYSFCLPQIVQCAARVGALRLGLLYIDDEPAAAQIWIVSGGKATILRLHYASKFAKLAVGVVLTYHMFRAVIENDHVQEIDFGRGNDSYKKKWLMSCRHRFGILVFNPHTIRGTLAAARHIGGHKIMDVYRTLGIAGNDAPGDSKA